MLYEVKVSYKFHLEDEANGREGLLVFVSIFFF
jgi:hypothetical protein